MISESKTISSNLNGIVVTEEERTEWDICAHTRFQ